MPIVNGFEVQARLAACNTPVPVVILTGHDSNETRDRALAGRPVAYLRKPVNDQTLLDAIELGLKCGPPRNASGDGYSVRSAGDPG